MQETIANFERIACELIDEKGPANCRKSWVQCKKQAKQFNPARDYIGKISPETLCVLCLVKTEEFSRDRVEDLQKIFSFHLNGFPENRFIEALKLFPFKDLEKTLLPFIYDKGNKGRVACYLAANLKVFASPEACEYFLKARTWSNSELMNLAHMIRKNEVFPLIEKLQQQSGLDKSGITKETFDEFRYILLNIDNYEPVFPDLLPEAAPEPAILEDQKTAAISEPEQPRPQLSKPLQAETNFKEAVLHIKKTFKSLSPLTKSISALILSIFLIFSFFNFSPDIEKEDFKIPPREKKSPEFWIDATNQTVITRQFLEADKDYRMGELYLTRDQFADAIILFKDALAQDADHHMARLRLGYSLMCSRQYAQAVEQLNILLNLDPNIKLANFYLARLALIEKDFTAARNFYQKEFNLNKDLSIGLEYAGFLQDQGEKKATEKILDELRKHYPDRTLIVSRPQIFSDEVEQ